MGFIPSIVAIPKGGIAGALVTNSEDLVEPYDLGRGRAEERSDEIANTLFVRIDKTPHLFEEDRTVLKKANVILKSLISRP